jgi:cation-transporting ATPase E
MKASDVSIAMENGASVTRSTADMVLINNDYAKLPEIFHEGENIIFNLNLSTKLFLAKSLFAILTSLVFIFTQSTFPIHPSSTLIFSFYGASLPSYILIFSRNKLPKQSKRFFTSVFTSAIPAGIIMSLFTIVLHYTLLPLNLGERTENTIQAMQLLMGSMIYALFVFYRSKKLTSITKLISWFGLGAYLGFIQTLLPLDLNAPFIQGIITMLLISLGSIAIIVLGFKYFVKRSFNKGLLVFILAILWFVILSIFPFRDYYHITTLNSEGILIILIMTIMYLIFFSLELLFWRVLFNKR